MNSNQLIKIEDLPVDIQNKIKEHQEEKKIAEFKKRLDEITNPGTNITVNNNNIYFITSTTNLVRNDGIINEKNESAIDQFMKAAGRAAGKVYAKLKE